MRNITLTFDDGSQHVYNNVPDEVTPEQVNARAINEFKGKRVANIDGGRQAAAPVAPVATAPAAPRMSPEGIPLDHDYKVPRKDAPLLSNETIGSIGGTILGGGAGVLTAPLTGPWGAVAGATLGSALGAAAGAYLDATNEGKSGDDARTAALNAAGVDLAWSIGGGIVLKYAGKSVKFAAGTEVFQYITQKLGFKPSAAPKQVAPVAAKKGDLIFDSTNPADAQRLADEAAAGLRARAAAEGRGSVTNNQIKGTESWAETQARAGAKAHFDSVKAADERFIQDSIAETRDRIARKDMSGSLAKTETGQKLSRSMEATEQATKDRHRATFEILSDPAGPLAGAGKIDVTDMMRMIDSELQKTANPEKIATLNGFKKLLGDSGSVDLSRANDLLKEWGAEAAGLAKPGQATSPLEEIYGRMAKGMREKFTAALDNAAANGAITPELRAAIDVAKKDYRVMHETLYSPTGSKMLRVAQTTPEDVLAIIGQKNAVTEIGELRRIVALAQTSGNNVAATEARAALRELQAAYFQRELPDAKALANHSQRMRDDKAYADQFNILMPNSNGVRQSVERLAQAAKIVERNAAGSAANTGLITGVGMGSASAIATMAFTGNPVMAAVASLFGAGVGVGAVTLGRKVLAHSLTKPTLRDKMPEVSAYAVALAAGKKVGIPQAVQAWYDELKADGFVEAAPTAATQPASEPTQVAADGSESTSREVLAQGTDAEVRQAIAADEEAFRNSPQGQEILRNMPPARGPGKDPVSFRTSPDAMLEDLRWAMANAKTPQERQAIAAEMRRAQGMR